MAELIHDGSPAELGLRTWADEPETEEDLDALLADAARWIDTTALLPDDATRRALKRDLATVRQRREALLSPLLVAIVGGTGVGKSTLLNALAGDAIAEAGVKRPTTQTLTVYLHESNRLGLDSSLAPAAQRVEHRRDELLDKVIVDTPDYDSIETAHRRQMEAVLREADVVLWVTTAEKYADLAGARWLSAYAEGRQFVFLLNRADEGVSEELLADVRNHLAALGFDRVPLLAVSAREAFEEGEAEGEFGELERLLERELSGKRIRQIKESNLRALVQRLLDHVAGAAVGDVGRRLADWRRGGEGAYDALRAEVAGRLTDAVAADPRLRHHVEYWFGFGVGGPVGACLGFVYALRALFAPAYPRLWEVSDAPPVSVADDEQAARIGRQVAGVRERLQALAADSGLPGGSAGLALPDAEAGDSLARGLDRQIGEVVGRAVRDAREQRSGGMRLLDLLLNVPTWLVLLGLPAWFVYDQVSLISGRPAELPLGAWQPVAVVMVLWLVLTTALAQMAVRARTSRFLGRLGALVARAVDGVLRRPLLGRLEEHLGRLEGEQVELERLGDRARRLGGSG